MKTIEELKARMEVLELEIDHKRNKIDWSHPDYQNVFRNTAAEDSQIQMDMDTTQLRIPCLIFQYYQVTFDQINIEKISHMQCGLINKNNK